MPAYNQKVINGKLPSSISASIKAFIEENEGKYITITIERTKTKRSQPQNKYYWSVILPIVRSGLRELGYTMTIEETHDFLKDKYLKEELPNKETGEIIGTRTKSTTELSKGQMVEYIDNIINFAAEILNVEIPPPMTQVQMNYEN